LTSVTNGSGLTNIGDGAFQGCTSLASVYFLGNAPAADTTAFFGDGSATAYYLASTTGWSNTFADIPALPFYNVGQPRISVQPQSAAVLFGQTASFDVSAVGATPLSFQWQFDGTNINNATNSALTLPSVTFNEAGSYSVTVSNSVGATNSSNAVLTVTTGGFQVFQFSEPISGSFAMSVKDLNGTSNASGTVSLSFNNLFETIYLDPTNDTLRQVGTISYTPSDTNLSFEDTQTNIITTTNAFPNPPTYTTNVYSGNAAVNLAPSGDVLSFDTSLQRLTWNPELSVYTLNAGLSAFPIIGSYSLITGGQTYSGTFSFTLTPDDAYTFETVAAINYPSSIQLSDLGEDGSAFSSPGIIAEAAASNGFAMELSADGQVFDWSSSPVTAANVTNVLSQPPLITSQPQPVVVIANNSASFAVTATGTPPLGYQWSFNGSNILGANESTLTIFNVVQTNLGTYSVLVSNAIASTNSSSATLSMYPYLTTPFTGLVTDWGYTNTLSVGAWGTGPLTYQWFDNGTAINGATNQELILTGIQFSNAGLYSVVVSNTYGNVTNTPEQVVVNPSGVSLGMYPGVTVGGVVGYTYNI
jgi:hypothetical protein